MSNSKATIQFYFDVVSPYSWFAFEQVMDPDFQKHFNLDLKPFFLGGVMKATGNQPPATLPARGKYMLGDLKRTASYLGMKPLKVPSTFPINTLSAQRLLAAISLDANADKYLPDVARALWAAYWVHDRDIVNEAVLHEILTSVKSSVSNLPVFCAKAAQSLLEASKSAAAKNALQSNTVAALNAGAFGAPTLVVRKNDQADAKPFMLFGSDRFPILFHELGVKNPPLGPKNYGRLLSKM